MAKRASIDPIPALASEVIKAYAQKQKIRVELSQDQVTALLGQWNDKDPKMPAEITFYAKKKPVIQVKVAGYRYRGNTCCV